ncbi:MAG: potassium channel family protein [Nitrososphaeraceae archaeon]
MKSRKIELFISLVTAASVAAILIQYVYPLNTFQMRAIYIFDFIVVVILAIDFIIRMNASEDGRLKFVLKYWYEIPAMIPLVAFTLLENDLMTGAAARGLRLRLFRLLQLFFRTLRIFEGSKYLYFVAFSTMAIIIGAFGIYIAESHEETSTVRNLGDAFWLAIGTITSATYGDVYPVSIEGRAITVVLMFVGLAILGVFVSTIGATIIESRLRKSQVHKRLLANDTKGLIKSKIDEIEVLSQQDFNYLMIIIGNLRDMLLRGEREYFKQ